MARIGVIGPGNIGKHIIERAPGYGYETTLVVDRKGITNAIGNSLCEFPMLASRKFVTEQVVDAFLEHQVRYAMLAIPSGGDGLPELSYIQSLTGAGIKVITAGKSALANHFQALQFCMPRLKYDAACGGGAMILPWLKNHLYPHAQHPFAVTAVLNGTLNYAQWRVQNGGGAQQIVQEALALKYAEPTVKGQKLTPLDMYLGEFGDICRKITIICNTTMLPLLERPMVQNDLRIAPFTESDRQKVMARNSKYRYMVRIYSHLDRLEFFENVASFGGHIMQPFGKLFIAAGFVELQGALEDWAPTHAGNACEVDQGGETPPSCNGEGAGEWPTVGTMFSNLRAF
jgi:homoserine dehydrogenase